MSSAEGRGVELEPIMAVIPRMCGFRGSLAEKEIFEKHEPCTYHLTLVGLEHRIGGTSTKILFELKQNVVQTFAKYQQRSRVWVEIQLLGLRRW